MNDYDRFLDAKAQFGEMSGFDPVFLPDWLFQFQRSLTEWALRKGRSAIFADCGLGKTPMQLVWAENVVRHTGKPVLILAPLAVSIQTVGEGQKFGIEVRRTHDGHVWPGINITNYERLHYYHPESFGGVVCDESSILKSFDGSTRQAITVFMRKLPYRLLATATAAPNDYTELGTSSEALGYMGNMDMLNKFFRNDKNNSATGMYRGRKTEWRFKGHAERPFWRWVCSWARSVRRPSDIGFEDDGFILPALTETEHKIRAKSAPEGMLFNLPAVTLWEQRDELRRTIGERCERVAEIAREREGQVILWCHLNDEGDELERLLPGSVQVSGSDSEEKKEAALMGFARGEVQVLITKPKIGGWGMNFQSCHNVGYFPSHSYEQYYQAVRRCWRFGQKRPVHVDIVATDGERGVLENLKAKSRAADKMFSNLVAEMNRELGIVNRQSFEAQEEVPSWL